MTKPGLGYYVYCIFSVIVYLCFRCMFFVNVRVKRLAEKNVISLN